MRVAGNGEVLYSIPCVMKAELGGETLTNIDDFAFDGRTTTVVVVAVVSRFQRTGYQPEKLFYTVYVCMVVTYSRVWINRVRMPILLVVS